MTEPSKVDATYECINGHLWTHNHVECPACGFPLGLSLYLLGQLLAEPANVEASRPAVTTIVGRWVVAGDKLLGGPEDWPGFVRSRLQWLRWGAG